jgi:Domain of unknown function (DUF5666)
MLRLVRHNKIKDAALNKPKLSSDKHFGGEVMKLSMRVLGFLSSSFFLLLAGCAELGQLGNLGDYGNWVGSELAGEVRAIDTRARQIDLSTDNGRRFLVRYDNNTRVSYRQRDYAVADLEPGDYIAARAQQDRDGRYFTDLIIVKESVQERGGYGGGGGGNVARLERLEGRVEYVDSRRGTFEIRDRSNRLVVVSLPYDAPRAISDRFKRLREGDYVRVEGRFLNRERFELENFV